MVPRRLLDLDALSSVPVFSSLSFSTAEPRSPTNRRLLQAWRSTGPKAVQLPLTSFVHTAIGKLRSAMDDTQRGMLWRGDQITWSESCSLYTTNKHTKSIRISRHLHRKLVHTAFPPELSQAPVIPRSPSLEQIRKASNAAEYPARIICDLPGGARA